MAIVQSSHKSTVVLGIVIAVILAVSGFLRIYTVNHSTIQKDLWSDSHKYFSYAKNLRKYGVYSHYNKKVNGVYSHSDDTFGNYLDKPPPDDFVPPGYPLFVYLFLSGIPDYLDNQNVKPVLQKIKVAQAVLSTITVLVAFLIARYIFGIIPALVCALIIAIAPHLVIANLYILTESLFSFVLTVLVLLIVWSYGKSKYLNGVIGALIAGACLIKPAFLFFIIPLALLQFSVQKDFRALLLLFFGFALVYSPWLIRSHVSQDIVPGKSLVATTLLAGAYPDLVYNGNPRTYPYPFLYDPTYKDNSRSTGAAVKEIWRRFKNEPARFINWYLLGKPKLLLQWGITHGMGGVYVYPVEHSPYSTAGFFQTMYRLSHTIHWPLVALSLIGCVMAWLPGNRNVLGEKAAYASRVISIAILYFLFIHIVTYADARYAVPLRPFIITMSLLPVVYLGAWLKITGRTRIKK